MVYFSHVAPTMFIEREENGREQQNIVIMICIHSSSQISVLRCYAATSLFNLNLSILNLCGHQFITFDRKLILSMTRM